MGERREKLGVLKLIGENLRNSSNAYAQPSGVVTMDLEKFVQMREEFKKEGKRISSTACYVKAVALGLEKYPELNARLDGDEIVYYDDINVGVGVDTAKGLMVIVVREVQNKSLEQIAEELNDLVDRARIGKLTMDDITGSTITISNLDKSRIEFFESVINNDEAVIMGFGRIQKMPVVDENDQIVVHHVGRLIDTINHTLTSGVKISQFDEYVATILENPKEYLLK